jgi:putative membrane protein
MTKTPLTLAAIAALTFAAAACSKTAKSPAAAEAASAAPATPADGAVAKTSDAVSVAQDTASAVVGPVSAATVGSLSAAAFVDNAAQSDLYETEASKLALERARSAEVKSFARHMIAAHAKTTAELTALVQAGKAGDAKLPDALDQRRQGLIDNLKSASADDFDARFVDQQVAAHIEAHTLMGGYGKAGSNADLKAFAAKTAPDVAGHLKMAKALHHSNGDHDVAMADGSPKGE